MFSGLACTTRLHQRHDAGPNARPAEHAEHHLRRPPHWHRRLAVGGPRSGVAPGRPRAEPTGLNPTTGKMTGAPTGKAPDTVLLALRDPTGAVKRRPGERRLQCDDNTNHGRQYRVAVKVWTALALDPRGHLRAPLRETRDRARILQTAQMTRRTVPVLRRSPVPSARVLCIANLALRMHPPAPHHHGGVPVNDKAIGTGAALALAVLGVSSSVRADNNRGLTSDSWHWRPWPAIPASGRSRSRPLSDPNAHVRSNAEEILRERDRAKQRSPRALQRMPAEEGRGQ